MQVAKDVTRLKAQFGPGPSFYLSVWLAGPAKPYGIAAQAALCLTQARTLRLSQAAMPGPYFTEEEAGVRGKETACSKFYQVINWQS